MFGSLIAGIKASGGHHKLIVILLDVMKINLHGFWINPYLWEIFQFQVILMRKLMLVWYVVYKIIPNM